MAHIAVLALVGASGAGQTTAVRALAERHLSGVGCYFVDSIGVPPLEVMERDHGSGEGWQRAMTDQWVQRLAVNEDGVEIAVLEGQTRPSFLNSAFLRAGIERSTIV